MGALSTHYSSDIIVLYSYNWSYRDGRLASSLVVDIFSLSGWAYAASYTVGVGHYRFIWFTDPPHCKTYVGT